MRTKKQMRKSRNTRFVLGVILMVIAIALMVVGYIAIEKKLSIVSELQNGKAQLALLITIVALWFAGAVMLFVGGTIMIIKRKEVYYTYPDRPYSSKL